LSKKEELTQERGQKANNKNFVYCFYLQLQVAWLEFLGSLFAFFDKWAISILSGIKDSFNQIMAGTKIPHKNKKHPRQ
jgi:hypothetical protein